MVSVLEGALVLAGQKVKLFPVRANSKLPAVENFPQKATNDPVKLREFFLGSTLNSGILCGYVSEGFYLVGLDIDVKNGKNGHETLEKLKNEGVIFPDTWSQKTPNGGQHFLFWSPIPIRQGTDVCGPGVDLRGEGGYLVGPHSHIEGKFYSPQGNNAIARFPDAAIQRYQKIGKVLSIDPHPVNVVNQITALKRSIDFVRLQPKSVEGNRNNNVFKIIAKMKDFGLHPNQMIEVLEEHWDCEPFLPIEDIQRTIDSAFKSTQNAFGSEAYEAIFDKVETTESKAVDKKSDDITKGIEVLNKNTFYIGEKGVERVVWETQIFNKFHLEFFPPSIFHQKYAACTVPVQVGETIKHVPLTKIWIKHPKRRTYDHIRFKPGSAPIGEKVYNLWRGFHTKALEPDVAPNVKAKKAFDDFISHCFENICDGDPKLLQWLLGFFAHIFQHPEEKPQVALVFKGKKGTGKTIIAEILQYMIGKHAVIVSDRAHMSNHFNSIMEDKLLFVLDEAFWSGDKGVEGILKSIITGKNRVITHKGQEPFTTEVYDRIMIISNEDRVVNATESERRFAVFEIGEGRKQDQEFFSTMREGMEKFGGAELLMRYFLNFDISKININQAPKTKALDNQKENSLKPIEAWWLESLQEGIILGAPFEVWPSEIYCLDLFKAFVNGSPRSREKEYITGLGFGKMFAPLTGLKSRCKKIDKKVKKIYEIYSLDEARSVWEKRMGYKREWD